MKIIQEEETVFISVCNAEHFMKIGKGMTSEECFENKRLYIKYLGKYVSAEILLTRESTIKPVLRGHL